MILQKSSIIVVLFGLYLACSGCSNNKKPLVKAKEYQEVRSVKIKINFNQSFELKEIRKGTSLADIHVSGIGFQNNSRSLCFKNTYPYCDFFMADLNQDGFEELYIITSSGGKSKKTRIHGVTSVGGVNYKSIYIPGYNTNNQAVEKYFKNYAGNDSIYINDNYLKQKFSLSNEENLSRKIEKRILTYKLFNINNSYSLQIIGTE